MAYGAYILAAVVIIAAIWGYMVTKDPPDNSMDPNTMDSFQVTASDEGAVVPFLTGKRRVRGNLLWYGNLETIEQTENVGKGGDDDMTTGYKYYMDLWQAICLGPGVTLTEIYSQNKKVGLAGLGTYVLNPGDTDDFPPQAGIYSAPLHGIANIFLDRFYLGENVSFVPTIHFVAERTSDAPLTYANLSTGTNPAAAIYDLCALAGAESSDFDLSSFQEAADYWNTEGYGINLLFNKQQEVRLSIRQVLVYVDGAVRVDENDKIVLKAFRDSDTFVDTFETEDFKSFQFYRRTWDDVHSDFRANYVDEDQDFTKRTIRVRNPAVRKLIGYDRQKTIDLSAFRSVTVASKRLTETMKKMSYPEAQIECTVPIKFVKRNVGDIIRINHSEYGLAAAEFRITRKDEGDLESNEVKFRLVQKLSGLFDSSFAAAGGSLWSTPPYIPAALVKQNVFELPYNSNTGNNPAYLLLAQREGIETMFTSLVSIDAVDYNVQQRHFTFSQYGTLDETYNKADTYWLDDTKGIAFTSYRNDPEFLTISRTSLFGESRVAIIGDEMIAFQTVTLEAPSQFRLTGCIRGLLNTPIQNHAINDPIWLTNIGTSILTGVGLSTFWIKLIPYFGARNVDPASAVAMNVVQSNKAATPWSIGRIQAIRSGTSLSIKLWPSTQYYPGAGVMDMSTHTDKWPPDFGGSFEYYTNIVTTIVAKSEVSFNYTQSGAHYLYVRHVISGFASPWRNVYILAADDTYIGPNL